MVDWAIVTGEYPPQPGGVSDYTRQVAEGLIDAGEEVVVFAPSLSGRHGIDPDFVERLPDHFGPRGLWNLERSLRRRRPKRILLQYTPHAFGWKAMNLPLCLLLSWNGLMARSDVRVMFHEVALPYGRRRPILNAVAFTHRMMARLLKAGARRIYLSTASWTPLIEPVGRPKRLHWLPVPANVALETSAVAAAAAIRRRVSGGDPDAEIVGHFGTYGEQAAVLLRSTLESLLHSRRRLRVLLIGRGAARFRESQFSQSMIAERIVAAEDLDSADVAAHLTACDLVLQPYSDGVSTRRTTTMAALACGIPVVTNLGVLSEPLWSRDSPAAAAATPNAVEMALLAERLLNDAEVRAAAGRFGREYYDRAFALKHSLKTLLNDD